MGCFCRKRGCSHRHQEGFRVPIPPSCSTSFSWEGKRREKSRESLLCLLETMPHRISICLGGLLETRMLCFCLWERSPVASLSDISWGRLDFFFFLFWSCGENYWLAQTHREWWRTCEWMSLEKKSVLLLETTLCSVLSLFLLSIQLPSSKATLPARPLL